MKESEKERTRRIARWLEDAMRAFERESREAPLALRTSDPDYETTPIARGVRG